jgi:hypothetical protein
MSESGRDKALGVAAALLVVLIVASLSAAGYFMSAGAKARRAGREPAPPGAPGRPSPGTPEPITRPVPRPRSQKPTEPIPEPTPAFEGAPLDWSVTKDQEVQLLEPFPEGARLLFVILGADYSVHGTLFLNGSRPSLPSNFLVKDESWGADKRFGGEDILLGVVAVEGTYSDTSLRRAASDAGWWKGKLKPAFQMNY